VEIWLLETLTTTQHFECPGLHSNFVLLVSLFVWRKARPASGEVSWCIASCAHCRSLAEFACTPHQIRLRVTPEAPLRFAAVLLAVEETSDVPLQPGVLLEQPTLGLMLCNSRAILHWLFAAEWSLRASLYLHCCIPFGLFSRAIGAVRLPACAEHVTFRT